jgi:hypothetical protein
MATPWMNPLARAERLLTVRLLALERTLPENPADAVGWAEYLRTLEILIRVIERTQGPGAPGADHAGACRALWGDPEDYSAPPARGKDPDR